jgi:phage baseplate assembly protein gpV
MPKNILSDTDYTKGWDNRFGVTAAVGRVSRIEVSNKGANVRVIMPDRVDHDNQPLISKPIPVLQIASTAKKSFAVPRLNDNVLMAKLPNGTSNYVVIGSFYTSKDPPPVSDPMLDYTEYDDGSTMKFDASNGELTWKLLGDALIDNDGDWWFKLTGDFKVDNDGDSHIKSVGDVDIWAHGDMTVNAGGTMDIESPDITIAGSKITIDAPDIYLNGFIHHNGHMISTGAHQDANGFHTGATIGDSEQWKWTNGLTDASSSGEAGLDAASWAAATEVHLSMITNTSRDMTAVFSGIIPGNQLRLQAEADSTRYGRYNVTGAGVQTGGWWPFPVELIKRNGAVPSNNALTTVSLIQPPLAPFTLMQRLAVLEKRLIELESRQHGS